MYTLNLKSLFVLLLTTLAFAQNKDTIKAPSTYSTGAIIINGNKINKNDFPQSIEESLKRNSSITLINRGNVAMEPGLYGFSMGPVSISLDGITIQGACVDHMDPGSSYIEPENLKQIGINSEERYPGFTNETVGNLDFVTEKPNFDFVFRIRNNSSYNSNGNGYKSGTVIDYSTDNLAYRASFTVRQGNNYRAGSGITIPNSNFIKYNSKHDLQYNFNSQNSLLFSLLYDNSNFTGFPALIMDATGATSIISSVTFVGTGLIASGITHQVKIYDTRINHKMDDFYRTTEEIKSRIAMPNMYMPMVGENKSIGLQLKIASPTGKTKAYSFGIELKKTTSFADMKMIPLIAAPEMYLYNIGDVQDYEFNFSGSLSRFYDTDFSRSLSINYGVSLISRKLENQNAINAIKGFDSQFMSDNSYFLPKLVVRYKLPGSSDISYEAILKLATRAPLAVETYGYYLFSPLDNFYYMGNSRLTTEKSGTLKLSASRIEESYELGTSAFCIYFSDYIIGGPNASLPPIYGVGFKQYGNFGNAYYAGIEIYASKQIEFLTFEANAKYHISRSLYFNDPLPFTSPVSGMLSCSLSFKKLFLNLNFNWSTPSVEYSKIIAHEKEFPGETEINLSGSYEVSEMLTLHLKILNLLDKPNKSRFSVNDLSLPGINMQAGFNFYFDMMKEEL